MLENTFFNNRVVDAWNSLTNEIIMSPPVSILKNDYITLLWTVSYQYSSFFMLLLFLCWCFLFRFYAYLGIAVLSLFHC